MMNTEFYIKGIGEALALLCKNIEIFNCVSFYDINIISEDLYAQLLNKIYGYRLCNLNTYEKNTPAIDLGDESNKIAYQVTSDNDSAKIKKTIDKFIEHKLYLKYDRLIVLVLVKKKNYTTNFDTKNVFLFDKNKDIIDYTDLIRDIKSKDKNSLNEIYCFLYDELFDKLQKSKITQASEVDTIIDLIEYISKNRGMKKRRDTIIDPEYKIKRRFKEFAERLENQYTTLVPYYSKALEMVNETLEIDEAQDLITTMYLQDISIGELNKASDDPIKALENLVHYFGKKLEQNGKKYDRAAIKFYLLNELIKCNVFPNVGGQ